MNHICKDPTLFPNEVTSGVPGGDEFGGTLLDQLHNPPGEVLCVGQTAPAMSLYSSPRSVAVEVTCVSVCEGCPVSYYRPGASTTETHLLTVLRITSPRPKHHRFAFF